MKPLIWSAIIFALTLCGIYLGTLLRRTSLAPAVWQILPGKTSMSVAETAMAATWKELLVEINNDLSIIAKCREHFQSCSSPAAFTFATIAKEGDRYEGMARIGHLNRAANFAIRTLDSAHADDEWRSPLAILSRGIGDCKHHALLKYAIFREIGVSPDALKIIVVEVRSTHQLHAILAVRAEKGGWLVLDNRTLVLVESSIALNYYDPLYERDQNGVPGIRVALAPAPSSSVAAGYSNSLEKRSYGSALLSVCRLSRP